MAVGHDGAKSLPRHARECCIRGREHRVGSGCIERACEVRDLESGDKRPEGSGVDCRIGIGDHKDLGRLVHWVLCRGSVQPMSNELPAMSHFAKILSRLIY